PSAAGLATPGVGGLGQPVRVHPHALNVHVHLLDLQAAVVLDRILDSLHDVVRQFGDVDAVLHDDVQVDGDGVVAQGDLHAPRDVLAPAENSQPFLHAAGTHADEAIALGGRDAGNRRDHFLGDGDAAEVRIPALRHAHPILFEFANNRFAFV